MPTNRRTVAALARRAGQRPPSARDRAELDAAVREVETLLTDDPSQETLDSLNACLDHIEATFRTMRGHTH